MEVCEKGRPSAKEVQRRPPRCFKVGLPTDDERADTLDETHVMKREKLRRVKSLGPNGLNM